MTTVERARSFQQATDSGALLLRALQEPLPGTNGLMVADVVYLPKDMTESLLEVAPRHPMRSHLKHLRAALSSLSALEKKGSASPFVNAIGPVPEALRAKADMDAKKLKKEKQTEGTSPSPERGPASNGAAAADQAFYQVAPYQPEKGETPRRPRFLPTRAGEAAPGTVPALLGLPPFCVTLWNLCFGPDTVIGYLSKNIIAGGVLAIPRVLNYGVLFLLVLSFMGFLAYPTQAATLVGSWLRAGPHMVWNSFQEFLQALFWDLAGFSWSPTLHTDTCTCSPNEAASSHRGPLHGFPGDHYPPPPRDSRPLVAFSALLTALLVHVWGGAQGLRRV